MGIFDSIKKSLQGADSERTTPVSEALKKGPSEEGLEARLENDYEEHTRELEKKEADTQESFVLEDVYFSESDAAEFAAEAKAPEDVSVPISQESETLAAAAVAADVATAPAQETGGQDWSWQEVAAQKEAEAAAVAAQQQTVYVHEQEYVPSESNYGDNTMNNEVTTQSDTQQSQQESKKGTTLSHISEEATVRGDITTAGHLEVLGKVKGNIEADGNVAVQGNIKGDIVGSKIGLYRCKIKGNLDASVGVVADTDALIIGDVKTQSIILDGRLKGDIDAENVVVIKENGYYLGDIVTGSISIENGAIVNGHVQTVIEGDIEAPFED